MTGGSREADTGRTAAVAPQRSPAPRSAPAPRSVLAQRDGFAAWLAESIGGPIGRHAGESPRLLNPTIVAVLLSSLTFVVCVLRQLPCAGGADSYRWMCYSDVHLLFVDRGLAEGNTPYLDAGDYPVLEYPVLTGWLMEFERWITDALGRIPGTLGGPSAGTASETFFHVNTVLMFVFLLVTVVAVVRIHPARPWDALMLAVSPCVALASLINWDLFPVALTAVAMLAWARSRPGLAGVLLGLGMAAKLYPVLLFGPLFLLCLRSGRLRAFGATAIGFVVSWLLVNLPVLILAPQRWLTFWTFNSDRSGDFGSFWYVFELAGSPVEHLNVVNAALFGTACLAIGVLIMLAPRRPRFAQVAFLVVAAFLLVNKVYSPQYVLWLLPLVILARPRWREWLVFTVGEVIYFGAIWWHLGGLLAPGDGGADRLYWLAVLIRLGTQAWVVAMVVRDIVQPHRDPIRSPGVDDPSGGVLDRTTDVGWVSRLQGRVRTRLGGAV